MTRDEAEEWLVNVLLDKIRSDRYPSATQMNIVEEVIPQEMMADYLEVLTEKVAEDKFPSIPMVQRIRRLVESMPETEPRR